MAPPPSHERLAQLVRRITKLNVQQLPGCHHPHRVQYANAKGLEANGDR